MSARESIKSVLRTPEIGTFLATVVLYAAISAINRKLLTMDSILTLLTWFIPLSLLAIGQTFALVIAGIDLSVGSLASLSSMIFAYILTYEGWSPVIAFILVIAIGILVGLWHGFFVTKFSPPLPTTMPAFIITLTSLILLRGIAILMTMGYPIKITNQIALAIISSNEGRIIIFVIMLLIAVIIEFYTHVGRFFYAVGGNMEAAKIAGIPINKTRLFAFVFSGITASIGGLLYAGLIAGGYADIASGQELYSIASCAIGGVSLAGGEGTVIGGVVGALLISIVRMGIISLGVSPYAQDVVTAIILIIAISVDFIRRTWRRK